MRKNETIHLGKVKNIRIKIPLVKIPFRKREKKKDQKQDRRIEHGKISTVEYAMYEIGEGRYY